MKPRSVTATPAFVGADLLAVGGAAYGLQDQVVGLWGGGRATLIYLAPFADDAEFFD